MNLKKFNKLAYENLDDFVFGKAVHKVTTKNGLTLGNGIVYPELNFTLPTMNISESTFDEVIKQYSDIITDAAKRAVELEAPGFVAEIELLPPTTYNPKWGIEITKVVRDIMSDFEAKNGLKSALRLTPVDIREDKNTDHMWRGNYWNAIMETFEGAAKAGADYLSIESIGGKDVHDDAIMYCEIDKSLFALGVLGVMDMHKLWSSITDIANRYGSISAGDTACGFANTAMVLADKGYIPKVFSAVVRNMAAIRSLAAYEAGAVGPHKDCGYEGVYVKAITGTPISMEGKSSACAHLSSLGNIAAAVTDLWSNESVQNIKLLGGMAPTVSMEQLIYDTRLMNVATENRKELFLRDLFVSSDSKYDPQAYVLRPDVVLDISKKVLEKETPFERTKEIALITIEKLRNAIDNDELSVNDREISYLDIMEMSIEEIPDDKEEFTRQMVEKCASEKFKPEKYDL